MSTLTLPVEDVLADLEFEVPCNWPDCDTAAAWMTRVECCGNVSLVCDSHLAALARKLPGSQWACRACRACFPVGDSFVEHCSHVGRI